MAICKGDLAAVRSEIAGAVCAFGVFDGLHEGHRRLISAACDEARATGRRAVALTFDVDPDELFAARTLRKLLSNDDRLALLDASGVDAVAALPFTREFAALSPAEFLARTFGGAAPAALHVGAGFRFGARAAGTEADLAAWGEAADSAVTAHPLVCEGGSPVSATRIRALLAAGESLEEANRLLGRPYFLRGTVVAGRGEGADMGIRTANLRIDEQLRALGDGVYAAYAHVGGARYKAAVNMGVAATFADRATANCEVHLLDFSGDLYGRQLTVEFRHWLRPMRPFDDVDELIATIKANIAWVREHL